MRSLFALALAALCLAAHAQSDFPSKPIRILNPYPPGGASDVIARSIGERLTQKLKQPVIVDSRTGASGMIGAAACKAAPPDGYNYCILFSDILVVNPYIYKKVAYNVDRDFVPVVDLVNIDSMVTVRSSLGINSLQELVEYARKNPGKLTWASVGQASSPHLIMEKVAQTANVQINHIPYQGAGPGTMAMLGGQIDASMTGYGNVAPYVQQGTIKPLAVLGNTRLPLLPNVPTLREEGVGFTGQLWQALFAPAGTPAQAIEVMNKTINEVLADPAYVKQHLAPLGFSVSGGSPGDLRDRVRREQGQWGDLAKALNLSLE